MVVQESGYGSAKERIYLRGIHGVHCTAVYNSYQFEAGFTLNLILYDRT